MTNPVIFDIKQHDGSKRMVIVEPVLEKLNGTIAATGTYKIYKSSIDNQSSLFTEKLEIDEKNDDLPDEKNPDFLGDFSMRASGEWHYEGDLLNNEEQEQLARHLNELISS